MRVLIVDDEPLARERIRTLLQGEADVELIGECGDGRSAVTIILERRPDLVFLDVQMPRLDGFGVLEKVGVEKMPMTIFVTAYDRYALQAFDVNALDYLLKPFDRDRFRKALKRAREMAQGGRFSDLQKRLVSLLQDVEAKRKPLERLAIRSSGKVAFVRIEEIDWVEAAGNYLRLHVGKEMHLLRETMNELEAKLHPDRFLRIHRSTIVNTDRIRELQPLFHGEYVVVLKDGTELTVGRSYRANLERLLNSR